MPTHNSIGLQTVTGVSLPQNPPYTHSWRDASSSHMMLMGHKDIFAVNPNPQDTPWVAEHRVQFQSPPKYSARVQNMTVVHTGGLTEMAHVTHHTRNAQSPLGGTLYRGLHNDAAFDEEVFVSRELVDKIPDIIKACQGYQLHCPDGWITTSGFVVSAKKAGVSLDRAQFLAIERAVPKDTMGRINYYAVAEAVQRLAEGQPPPPSPSLFSTTVMRTSRAIP